MKVSEFLLLQEETVSGDVVNPGDPSKKDQKKKPKLFKRNKDKEIEEETEEITKEK
jgi:hypothetical protein